MEELKCPFYIILIIILAGKVKKMEKKINPSDKPRMDSFLVNSNTEHLIRIANKLDNITEILIKR